MNRPSPPRKIPLSQGQVALVDAEDYDRVAAVRWYADYNYRTFYAARNITVDGRQRKQFMHRFILGVTDSKVQVDHRDHDGLNNQQANLRKCNAGQNQGNARKLKPTTSQFKGVCLRKSTQRWAAVIGVQRKRRHIGYFPTELEAAKAYDAKAREIYGEFAHLNFPNEIPA